MRALDWGYDGTEIRKDQRYDGQGRLLEADLPFFAGAANYKALRNNAYDDLGRVTEVLTYDETGSALSSKAQFNGLTTVLTNLANKPTTQTKDAIGHLVQVIDSGSGSGAPGVTTMTYDAFDNLLTTKDPNGNKITITYDR